MKISENFNRSEFGCKCKCDFDVVDAELLTVLEDVRRHFGDKPVTITSANRCNKHNKDIGGSTKSQHIFGKAVDFKIAWVHADDVADYLEEKFQSKYGIGRYIGRTHIDVRQSVARWDNR